MAHIVSVNLAVARPNTAPGEPSVTGIDKRPVDGPVRLSAPGVRKGVSGVAGDRVYSTVHHGGDDQAVYAYAREDLDAWEAELGRELPGGVFGENLTTTGLDVSGALLGERWRIGEDVVLEVAAPRIPCNTFAAWMRERGWIKRFTARATPGAYLRVVAPGDVRAGDRVEIVHRPDHDVTIGLFFRAWTTQPELLPRLLAAGDALPAEERARIGRRVAQPG